MGTTTAICFTTFLSLALAINNYPIYNDLLDLEANVIKTRYRRDVDSYTCYDYNSCCDISHVHDNDSMQKCIEELHIVGRPTEEEIKCIAECMAKTDGYMNENGDIDKQKFKEFLMNQLQAYSDWLDESDANSVVDSCLQNIEDWSSTNSCNDIALIVGHCVAGNIQLHCPIDKQKCPKICAALQEYIKEHGGLPPPGHNC